MATSRCIGTIACLSCGHDVPVKENERGALNLSCGYCDLSAYAKKGTQAERIARGKLRALPGAESDSATVDGVNDGTRAAPVAPTQPAAPAKKRGALPWTR